MNIDDKEFLLGIKNYIEDMELIIDGMIARIWCGPCRDINELIADNAMTPLYNEVLSRLEQL